MELEILGYVRSLVARARCAAEIDSIIASFLSSVESMLECLQ